MSLWKKLKKAAKPIVKKVGPIVVSAAIAAGKEAVEKKLRKKLGGGSGV